MEKLGLYNKYGEYLNETIDRKNKLLIPQGKYYKVVIVFIINDNKQFLIQKSSEKKGKIYETLGGHVAARNTSKETIIKELSEELSIKVVDKDIHFFKSYLHKKAIQEVYYIIKNIDLNKIIYQTEEVIYAEWCSVEQIRKLIKMNMFRKKNIIPFLQLIKLLNMNSD